MTRAVNRNKFKQVTNEKFFGNKVENIFFGNKIGVEKAYDENKAKKDNIRMFGDEDDGHTLYYNGYRINRKGLKQIMLQQGCSGTFITSVSNIAHQEGPFLASRNAISGYLLSREYGLRDSGCITEIHCKIEDNKWIFTEVNQVNSIIDMNKGIAIEREKGIINTETTYVLTDEGDAKPPSITIENIVINRQDHKLCKQYFPSDDRRVEKKIVDFVRDLLNLIFGTSIGIISAIKLRENPSFYADNTLSHSSV